MLYRERFPFQHPSNTAYRHSHQVKGAECEKYRPERCTKPRVKLGQLKKKGTSKIFPSHVAERAQNCSREYRPCNSQNSKTFIGMGWWKNEKYIRDKSKLPATMYPSVNRSLKSRHPKVDIRHMSVYIIWPASTTRGKARAAPIICKHVHRPAYTKAEGSAWHTEWKKNS